MSDEDFEEQASLYVLGLLEGEELRAFEARLASDPELSRAVDALRETAAQLAHTATPRALPPELHDRILAEVRAIPAAARTPSRSTAWLPWAIAAGLAVACLLLATDRSRLHDRIAALQHRDTLSQIRIASLTSQLDSAPKATAVVVWDADKQEGVLRTADVPPAGRERDYQLWIVDPQYGQPVDAGVFDVAQGGSTKISFKPKAHVSAVDGFAVSLERKGGVPKAEGPMVLAGK